MVEVDHGNGISTRDGYSVSEILVKVGDTVDRNNVIGLAGSTGVSTGTHLALMRCVRIDMPSIRSIPPECWP